MAANGRKPKNEMEIVRHLFSQPTSNEKGCIIPHLRPNAKGYIPVQPNGIKAKKWRAHRLVYHILVEEISDDMLVMHTCDIRNCINPKHLKLGTAKENTADMISKGRDAFRDNLPARKVTKEMVEEFRKMRLAGLSNVTISKLFGLSHETIREHLNGELIAI